jgi:hypothetical protein
MATIINADTSDGLKLTSDTSGLIEFQSAGVTKAGVNATGLTGDGSQLTGLPAGYTDSDALTLFNASGSAPVYACRAWVNFNGTGTVAIRASGNVSSITDNGTGNFNINFTTAMPDANYSFIASSGSLGASASTSTNGFFTPTTTSCRLTTYTPTGSDYIDPGVVSVAILR